MTKEVQSATNVIQNAQFHVTNAGGFIMPETALALKSRFHRTLHSAVNQRWSEMETKTRDDRLECRPERWRRSSGGIPKSRGDCFQSTSNCFRGGRAPTGRAPQVARLRTLCNFHFGCLWVLLLTWWVVGLLNQG